MNIISRNFVQYRYEIIAFFTGFSVMTLEVVGARMLAPYVGTSVHVWTAIIGVVLGALAFGIWYGGKIADRNHENDRTLGFIFFIAAVVILISITIQEGLLAAISNQSYDIRFSALVASLIMFAPASLLLGIVTPLLAKQRITSLDAVGRSVGRLDASSTVGSIVGTFLTGYFLLSWFGNRSIGLALVIVLIILSFLILGPKIIKRRIAVAVLAAIMLLAPQSLTWPRIADVDSSYSRYMVTREGAATYLRTDSSGAQSGYISQTGDWLPFDYNKRFYEVLQQTDAKKSLLIGGGAYTLPMALTTTCANCAIDVVEIDPKLDQIATEYFGYRPSPRISLIHEDGRTFLNSNKNSYDVILMDAFSSLTPPFQLLTKEAAQQTKDSIKDSGVVVMNVVDDPTDPKLLQSVVATYGSVFHSTATFKSGEFKSEGLKNFIVLFAQEEDTILTATKPFQANKIAVTPSTILRDDFAPVEWLVPVR